MSLSMLPPELLAQILNSILSVAVLDLWKTGDRAMQAKLKNSGVTDIDLRYEALDDPERTFPWPGCLKELQLRSFSVTGPRGDPSAIFNELMQQPPCLHTLSLTFEGAASVFDPSDRFESPPNQTAENAESITPNAPLSASIDPKAPSLALPSLTHLTLCDDNHWKKTLRFSACFSFPSVTHLTIRTPFDCSSFAALESLTLTSISQNFSQNLYFDTLKSCGPRLTLLRSAAPHDYNQNLLALVSNLKTFQGELLLAPSAQLPFDVASFSEPNKRLLRRLPSTSDWVCPPHVCLTSFESTQLPELIDRFLLPSFSALTTLDSHGAYLPPNCFHKLPRSLQRLQLYGKTKATNLNDARLHGLTSIKGQDAADWSKHREALLNYGSTRRGADMSFVKTYIDRVENGHLCGLPLGLTSLVVASYDLTLLLQLLLPPGLRSFDRGDLAYSSRLEVLPPFLTSLNLAAEFSNFNLADAEHMRFPTLPYLRIIEISRVSPQQASEIFPFLPRALSSLNMAITPGVFEVDALSSLPPRLNRFELATLIQPSKRAWLHLLPRHLTHLNLDGMVMDSTDLINLPPRLTELRGTIRTLTVQDLLSLPRSLRIFSCQPAGGEKRGLLEETKWLDAFRPFRRIFDLTEDELMPLLPKPFVAQKNKKKKKYGDPCAPAMAGGVSFLDES